MRPRIDTVGDDALEDYGFLKFEDNNLKSSFLQSLYTMRKSKLFCDVILNVESTDIHVHRNVMAAVSPYLMELFSTEQNSQKVTTGEGIPSYLLNSGMSKVALQILVDYAYKGSLEIPDALVKDVYLAAWKLRMETVIKECARHLIDELTADSCIEIRSLPGIVKNKNLSAELDSFIHKNFTEVNQSSGFLQLPCVKIEVLYQTKTEMSLVAHTTLARLVLDWMKRQLTADELSMDNLVERIHLLYLALDNSLQDCSDLPTGHESATDLVQDYKRLVLKCPNNKGRRKCLAQSARPRVLIYSRDISERESESSEVEPDWKLIGSTKVGENSFVSLVTLNGVLARISMQLRLNTPPTPSPVHIQEPFAVCPQDNSVEDQKAELFCEVAAMSGPKCGLGVAQLDGKLVVCGGYDRSECLKTVESYCPDTNTWTQVPNMREARGRVQIAVIDGTIYAVGGSNGTTELDTTECLPKAASQWQKCRNLPLARSNAGICALDGRIYCIGGWNGQCGIRQCDVLETTENKWTSIAPLHTGRTQAGVAEFNGQLWVVGGSDAWNCLGTVEVYSPQTEQWQFAAPLLTARRGCGLTQFNGKLYAVGGSDGSHSLSSTEIYDEATKSWVVGPSLNTPRSNVSVVVVKDKLYAVGGFSGKTFLNTMEYLDLDTNEWTTFVAAAQQEVDIEAISDTLNKLQFEENGKVSDEEENGTHKGGEKEEEAATSSSNNGVCENVMNGNGVHKDDDEEEKNGVPNKDQENGLELPKVGVLKKNTKNRKGGNGKMNGKMTNGSSVNNAVVTEGATS